MKTIIERLKKDEPVKCDLCKGTGYYGDRNAGIRGNTEYCPCDQCNGTGLTAISHALDITEK